MSLFLFQLLDKKNRLTESLVWFFVCSPFNDHPICFYQRTLAPVCLVMIFGSLFKTIPELSLSPNNLVAFSTKYPWAIS